ncbi:unnamed protein product [Rodentolepis nana]|uniref:Uncharacterized protein n=1 Tax=Rodentolepis nana TaxID=102285 RepID=A0A0R3T9T3_RODNA|nr:unnamed protein product [Rodentolepis nana]
MFPKAYLDAAHNSPSNINQGQPGFVNSPTPEGWALSITPYELSEYLFCACAFFNYLLAFFSDRLIPTPPQLILTRPIRPDELPADFDVVASDEMPQKAILKLEDGKSSEVSKEPEPYNPGGALSTSAIIGYTKIRGCGIHSSHCLLGCQ